MNFSLSLVTLARSSKIYFSAIVFLFIAMLISRIYLDGFVHGLDYGLFFPDGVHYAYRTLKFLGFDDGEASAQVANWFTIHGNSNSVIQPIFLEDKYNPVFHIVKFRLLYSILSLPFVGVLGIIGMIMVPIIVTLGIFLLIGYYGIQTNTKIVTIFLILVLSTSFTFPRWMISDLSDPLLAGLFFLVIPVLKIQSTKLQYSALTLLILLTSMTRLSIPYWIAIGFVLYIQRRRVQALYISLIGTGLAIPVLNAIFNRSAGEGSANSTEGLSLLARSKNAVEVVVTEIAQLVLMDRLFFLLLILGFVISILNITKIECQLFLAIFLVALAQEMYVGEVGVNLRYQLPAIPIMLYVIQANFQLTLNRVLRLAK